MTADEIHRRIKYLEGQINALQRKNTTLKRNIADLEDGGAEASTLASKWKKALSDCFDAVRDKLSSVNTESGFKSHYLESIDAIFSSKEANEISERLGSIKSDTRRKVNEFEDEIDSNNAKINRYQAEIDELRAIQANGVE